MPPFVLKNIACIMVLLLQPFMALPDGKKHKVYVAKISWHTGIVVPVYSMPDSIWPAGFQVRNHDYLEIGWGDRDYYPHPGFNFWYAVKAIFWPTPTTLHVNPLKERHIPEIYADTKATRIFLDSLEIVNLVRFIISQFEYNDKGKIIPVEEGLYPTSSFFAGSTKYYFPKNSNVWAAMALKRAGLKFIPVFYQTAGMVVNRAARLRGKQLHPDQ